MSTRNPSEPAPARIHLLAAREAPYVVVIRRKSSRLVHILRWNTQTDEIEHGSWFNGRLYEKRCDLSFDGRYMIYLAMGSTGTTWTGVCKPPFLRTKVDWPNVGTWHGGGVFQSPTRLEINPGQAQEDALDAVAKQGASLPFKIGILANPGYGEDEAVLYPRLERDGFRRAGPHGELRQVSLRPYTVTSSDDPGWVNRPTPLHPELRVRFRGFFGDRGRVFEWDLPEHPGLLDELVTWAAYDSLGQLIVARQGILYRYTREDLLAQTPSAVFDFESLERPIGPRGPSLEEEDANEAVPQVEFVEGNLPDLEVRALIIPRSEAPWVRQIRDLAGDFLTPLLRSWTPQPGEALRTPAFYLRQHDLIHVAEPPPSAGVESLRRACSAAFQAAGEGLGSSVALKPVGIDAGWNREEALDATLEAATQYVSADPTRKVFIVKS